MELMTPRADLHAVSLAQCRSEYEVGTSYRLRINSRSPAQRPGFPTPVASEPGPMPSHQRLGTNDRDDLQDRREPSVEPNKEPAISVGQLRPASHLASQNDQLLPKHCILRLKPALRLKRQCQDGQNETEQPDHSVSVRESASLSRRFGFSVHTPHNRRRVPRFRLSHPSPMDQKSVRLPLRSLPYQKLR
jgi:hypothetical protein